MRPMKTAVGHSKPGVAQGVPAAVEAALKSLEGRANFGLLLLGVAWYIRTSDQLVWAVLVAAVAITVLGLLFSPSAIGWVARSG